MDRKMNLGEILKRVDTYYEKNEGQEAERLLRESIEEAVSKQEDESLLQLLNELLGYYRETGQAQASYAVGQQAVLLAEKMGLRETLPYATTLLNLANAYRAGGQLEASEECYLQVQKLYHRLVSPEDMLMAGLQNNLSLLYQEQGAFKKARECLLKALDIAEKNGAEFETAVTCANLAGTCMQLSREEEAYAYAARGARAFEKMGVRDAHYSAALSAMGTYYYKKKEYAKAAEKFRQAMRIVEESLGKNSHYRRLKENLEACMREEKSRESAGGKKGLELCREYYETYGRPMLEKQFPEYLDKIAVGLAGEGSDCFGYDDAFSRDHDWGPDFCIWITEETEKAIGKELKEAYEQLPKEFKGFQRNTTREGAGRRGVMTISAFYKRLLQTDCYEEIDWSSISDAGLAAAVNGEVFFGGEGIFSAFREKLQQGYPEKIKYLKLAQSAGSFAQAAQYNYSRMRQRGDFVTAAIMLADGMREAMKLEHYLQGKYPPHDKWLYKSTLTLDQGEALCSLLGRVEEASRASGNSEGAGNSEPERGEAAEAAAEQLGAFLSRQMYDAGVISDTESYLGAHTEELVYKAGICTQTREQLAESIARLEFQAFDKVNNKGGRASCQNDWATFSIMRKSQYLTWNHTMLLQYLYDFHRELERGHNLIEEKYGRMMESTAPAEYEEIKGNFPELSEEKKQVIEQIVGVQVRWMEEFAEQYPMLADNARSVHTYDDSLYNTSYETYLRGELGTYSDKMLQLYGSYVVEYARQGRNLAFEIMENSTKMYGYKDLDAAEAFLEA